MIPEMDLLHQETFRESYAPTVDEVSRTCRQWSEPQAKQVTILALAVFDAAKNRLHKYGAVDRQLLEIAAVYMT